MSEELGDIVYYLINESNACECLLKDWGFDDAFIQNFIDKGFDLEALKYITLPDINILIPEDKLALRCKFRQKLFEWRYEQGYATPLADTLSVNSTFNWVNSSPSPSPSPGAILKDNRAEPSQRADNIVNLSKNLDLQNLLSVSLIGKEILNKKIITAIDRKQIVLIICEFWLNQNFYPTQSDYQNAVSQITQIFKKENEDLYIGNSRNRGILIQKFYSLTKKYQASGLLKSRYNLKRSLPEDSVPSAKIFNLDGIENECYENMLKDKEWIKFNNTPQNLVIEKWNNTFQLREKDFKNNIDLFLNWPILKQRIAAELIELDFDRKYPLKNTILYSKWEDFVLKIKELYKKLIKDSCSKLLLKALDSDSENYNIDSKNYVLTILLNSILIPSIIKDDKTVWKPTIIDGQNGLAVFVNNIKDIPYIIKNRKEKYVGKNCNVQPFIVVVGDSKEKLESFYIHYNEIFYECQNFLKALSVCFQIHQVLNIEYAKECLQVWHFIELYFFDIPISGKKSNALINLISDLNN